MPKQPNLIVGHALKSARLTLRQDHILKRYMDGLKQREIAEELGISQPVVAKTIKASIKKLRSVWPRYNQIEYTQRKILNSQ